MTSRIDAWASHERAMSGSEAARAEAEAVQHTESRRRATRVIAACASDVAEFRMLADMLGLDGSDISAAGDGAEPSPGPKKRHAA
jgi:hypothetical protein